jgi:sulfotransferase family protein
MRVDLGGNHGRWVFLFGIPRSGTTWIGKIFDSHPGTLYKHEPDTFTFLEAMPWLPDVAEAEKLRPMASHFLSLLPHINTAYVAATLPVFPKEFCSRWQFGLHLCSVLTAKLGKKMAGEFPVLPMVDYGKVPGLCVVWKSVTSLGRLGVFLRVARERRAVVIIRHPCGVIASIKRSGLPGVHFRSDPSEDYGLFELMARSGPGRRHQITVENLRTMLPIERLAWRWVLLYEKVIEDTEGVEGVSLVRYEDICLDTKRSIRKMFEFCGLSWSSQTEEFIERSTKVKEVRGWNPMRMLEARPGYFSIFRDPVDSATKWRSQLSPEEVERIYGVLGRSDLLRFYPRVEEFCWKANPEPTCGTPPE